jgi:hypothetical protein
MSCSMIRDRLYYSKSTSGSDRLEPPVRIISRMVNETITNDSEAGTRQVG